MTSLLDQQIDRLLAQARDLRLQAIILRNTNLPDLVKQLGGEAWIVLSGLPALDEPLVALFPTGGIKKKMFSLTPNLEIFDSIDAKKGLRNEERERRQTYRQEVARQPWFDPPAGFRLDKKNALIYPCYEGLEVYQYLDDDLVKCQVLHVRLDKSRWEKLNEEIAHQEILLRDLKVKRCQLRARTFLPRIKKYLSGFDVWVVMSGNPVIDRHLRQVIGSKYEYSEGIEHFKYNRNEPTRLRFRNRSEDGSDDEEEVDEKEEEVVRKEEVDEEEDDDDLEEVVDLEGEDDADTDYRTDREMMIIYGNYDGLAVTQFHDLGDDNMAFTERPVLKIID